MGFSDQFMVCVSAHCYEIFIGERNDPPFVGLGDYQHPLAYQYFCQGFSVFNTFKLIYVLEYYRQKGFKTVSLMELFMTDL